MILSPCISKQVTLELFSQQECNDTYAAFISNRRLKYGIVPESQMCAGHHTESKDTCQVTEHLFKINIIFGDLCYILLYRVILEVLCKLI